MSSKPAEGAPDDGKVDGTFHSPEWHAARVKELMAPRMTWEEYKGKEKEKEREEERKRQEQEELEVEYLKQVAADRERKLNKARESSGGSRRHRRHRRHRRRDDDGGVREERSSGGGGRHRHRRRRHHRSRSRDGCR